MDKLVYTRKEAAEALSLSLSTVDMLIGRNILRARKFGRRVLVPRTELDRLSKMNLSKLWPAKKNGKTTNHGEENSGPHQLVLGQGIR